MYAGFAAMAAAGLFVVAVVVALGRLAAPDPEPARSRPFLSGWAPTEHALSRYHVRWYPATLVFLAFDVEMLFMYPWAVRRGRASGASAVVEMFLFLGVLLVAVLWALAGGGAAVGLRTTLARFAAAAGARRSSSRCPGRGRTFGSPSSGPSPARQVGRSRSSPADADAPRRVRRTGRPARRAVDLVWEAAPRPRARVDVVAAAEASAAALDGGRARCSCPSQRATPRAGATPRPPATVDTRAA